MFRRSIQFNQSSNFLGGAWWIYATPGMMFILFGLLVVLVPEILVALVAGGSILIGVVLFSIGLRIRALSQHIRNQQGQDLRWQGNPPPEASWQQGSPRDFL